MPFISEVESIFLQRMYTGWVTLRNQLATPIKLLGRRVITLYDALITGNDWEVTPALSLKRRAGHTLLVAMNYAAMRLYSWKSNTQGTIPIFDTTGDVEYYNGSTVTAIATKGTGTGQGLQSSVLGIGNYLYVGNPNQSFKWDGPNGPQGKTKWGISIAAAVSAGPNTTGTASQSGTGVAWTNPTNVESASAYATVSLGGSFLHPGLSEVITCTNFGFSLGAGAQISGFVVLVDIITSGQSEFNPPTLLAQLYSGGAIGNLEGINVASAGTTTLTFGSTADLWGTTGLNATAVNASSFGVNIQASARSGGINWSVRNVRIQVFGNLSAPVATPTGSGTFSAVNGYTYVLEYGNSVSAETSNASQTTLNTGPFSNVAYVGIPVAASTDPQVNQIRAYRTTDTGGGNIYFELPNSPFPNTSTTIQDAAADTALQVTSQAEINLGNTPPPARLINLEWFAGRMWGSVNNNLFASTGPETISGNAPNSNWNPLFQWVIPGVIVRNIAGPNGMVVFTQDDSYIVRGTDITNYTVNEFVKDFGIRTFNAVDTDGTNMYVFTSDRQFICVSASGANDIGLPIGDQLLNVDPTVCYVSVNRYGLDSIVRLLDTVNNVYYDYNLNQQCWNLPGILQMPSCGAMGSIEVSPGVWRLLVSSGANLAYRDIANFQDLGTSYQPNAVFGTIQLADPGTLAKFGGCGGFNLQLTNAGKLPTLSVLPNDIGATLTNEVGEQITGNFVNLSTPTNAIPWPPTLGNRPTGYRSVGYYWMSAKGLSAFVLHLQFQISAPAENAATELLGWGIFGDYKAEVESAGAAPQLQGR
jgi:hypothetical protein